MEILGKVVAILDESKLVLEIENQISIDQTLTVFSEVKQPKLEELGLQSIWIPKGEIRVLVHQYGLFYLAQRFQSERIEKRRKPLNSMLNPLGQFLGEEEIQVVTKGGWSASFDKSQSLNVEYTKDIQIGDSVGIK